MLELNRDTLKFSFPSVHKEANLIISFQRTLRIPDDDRTYPLPPGFGNFPLRHIDDYEDNLPDRWINRGGVMMPIYQREALWIYFSPQHEFNRASAYPFAVKVYTGKINAVTGREFQNGLHSKKQDYLVVPGQPWLDGYCIEEGTIRQFVAMPLGKGYSAEEQITGEAEWGGIQIVVYPMDGDEYERRFPRIRRTRGQYESWGAPASAPVLSKLACMDMGIAPGGKMKQDVYKDPFGIECFDQSARARCYVHLLNSQDWKAVTGENPPPTPINEKVYTTAGYPWFDYYDEDLSSIKGSAVLNGLKSVGKLLKSKESRQIDDDEDDELEEHRRIIKLGPKDRRKVREGDFWDDSI